MAVRTLQEMILPQDWTDLRTKELVQNPKIRKYEDEGHDLRLIRIIDLLYFIYMTQVLQKIQFNFDDLYHCYDYAY